MSHNSDSYQLSASSSSPPTSSNQNNKWLPSSSSSIQNDFSSSQSHTSPIVNDVCAGSQNAVRNASTTMKMHNIISPNGNHSNEKYAFTLEFSPPVSKTKKYFGRNSKAQLFQFNMAANDQEDLHSPFELDVPLCDNPMLNRRQNDFLIDRMLTDESNSSYSSQQRSPNQSSYTNILNQASPLHTPSSDHHDTDALSDAGTYIIEDDLDIAHDDEPEPDIDQSIQENQTEQQPTSNSFKRYAKTKRTRQGTFDIHALVSSSSPSTATTTTTTTAQTVNRPVVDLNIPTHDITSPSSSTSSANLSSSSSSLLSLPTESDNSTRKEPEGASHYLPHDSTSSAGLIYARQRPSSLSQQQRSITPPQSQLKQAECFVISPTFETKTFPNSNKPGSRRKLDAQWKPKTSAAIPTKDMNSVPSNTISPSTSPHSIHSNQNDTERYSFRLQQQSRQSESKPSSSLTQKSSLHTSDYVPSSNTTTTRPHTIITDQTYLSTSSPFQRNSTVRQTMPANSQYNRGMSSSTTAATTTTTTNKYIDDNDEVLSSHPNLTKVYMNKSFALRRQRSHLVPSTTKPVQTQQPTLQQQTAQALAKAISARQPIKATTSIPSTSLTSSTSTGQTNRAVELRRARAQAKIEELANRTRHQLQKTEHHNDIMSASWHSNASSSSRKDYSRTKATSRPTQQQASQKQDLLKTRTISTSYHRSSSASPNPLGESTGKTTTYRRPMTSSVTDESQYRRMNGSTCSEIDRCDSLRDDGQRLTIKLIQLSSGILAKLKPNNTVNDTDSNARELEQLVDQLQTINRTLSTIDASLTGLTSDETVL